MEYLALLIVATVELGVLTGNRLSGGRTDLFHSLMLSASSITPPVLNYITSVNMESILVVLYTSKHCLPWNIFCGTFFVEQFVEQFYA